MLIYLSIIILGLLQIHISIASLTFQLKPNNEGHLLRRDNNIDLEFLSQSRSAPIIDLYFGSQGEKIPVMLDTGSYTSFVQSKQVSEKRGYDYTNSSSYENNNKDFSVQYADSTSYKGNWSKDAVSFDKNGDKINLNFGLVTYATTNGVSSDTNVFGLGYNYGEPTLFDQLKEKGLISRKTFSIYSSANDHSLGEIYFGAIDSAKYTGDLVSVPIKPFGNGRLWWSYLTDLEAGCESTTNGNTYFMNFDCGYTTGLTVPEDVHKKLLNNLGAFYEEQSKNYVFDCENASPIQAEVAGHKIEIPSAGFTKKIRNTDQCVLKHIIPGPDKDTITMGWIFFPYIYGVFDAHNDEILFGKPITDTKESNIQELGDSIPNVQKASKYSSVSNAVITNQIAYTSIPTSSVQLDIESTGVTSASTCSTGNRKRDLSLEDKIKKGIFVPDSSASSVFKSFSMILLFSSILVTCI
ncbi:putative cathepsin [Wickerhamomyces ciferrii]|uniref:Cathepsin n=1 Tax=Wickerhamomyces ciferrii (strain ATCC 14091 / BCRC 22168 / CBS 111 / JCM 3599 / NBRC 0793 / NRRL Y-1031 F-60-10) TaxID=1206466 RepID=K0KUQ8_WICCF|nr:putative cathepsin [Wickerhamomyces ciferrii]CCH46936.1 putative cathepsin [Wickerhamomyces ciferrii]